MRHTYTCHCIEHGLLAEHTTDTRRKVCHVQEEGMWAETSLSTHVVAYATTWTARAETAAQLAVVPRSSAASSLPSFGDSAGAGQLTGLTLGSRL